MITKTNCKNCGKVTEGELFCSDICETVYNKEPKGAKPLEAVEQQNKVQKYCKECGKPISNNLTFCSAKCIREFKFKEKNPDKTMNRYDGSKFIDNNESEESATDYMKRREAEKKSGKKTEQKQVKNNEVKNDLDFQILLTGDGMKRRDHNIDVIKNYALIGLSFNEIWKRVRRKLTSGRLEEYYNIVLDEINGERQK